MDERVVNFFPQRPFSKYTFQMIVMHLEPHEKKFGTSDFEVNNDKIRLGTSLPNHSFVQNHTIPKAILFRMVSFILCLVRLNWFLVKA